MQRNAGSRRIRIWSAGCSTGEEAVLRRDDRRGRAAGGASWDLQDSRDRHRQRRDRVRRSRACIRSIASRRCRRSVCASFFQKGTGAQAGKAIVKAQLRAVVTFRVLNLLQPWPMHGPFDVIFCRNVMIYFDQATRERLVSRFAQMLAPGGYLCIGHSESIHSVGAPFRLVGKTIYRRSGGEAHGG